MKLTYTQTKELINTLKNEYCIYNYKEVIKNITSLYDEFYSPCGNYRFINSDAIDEIMQNELYYNEFTLGGFDADFLSHIINIDLDIIQEIQKAGAFEALGKLVIRLDKLEELQQDYVSEYDYGHYFAIYDGCTNEIHILHNLYYVFKVNYTRNSK